MSGEIYWLYTLTVKEGALENFKALIEELVEKTREEDGAIAYQFSTNDDGFKVHIFEHYRDSAAVVSHVKQVFQPRADRMKALTDTTSVTVYGDPDAAVREITDQWGAVYMTAIQGFLRSVEGRTEDGGKAAS